MKKVHYDEVENQPVDMPGAEGVRVRWLISEADGSAAPGAGGAPHFCMRRFELEPAGCTPRHTHAWEHEVYILEGEGVVFGEGAEHPFRPGDVIYVAPSEEHQFIAGPDGDVAFLCMIPARVS